MKNILKWFQNNWKALLIAFFSLIIILGACFYNLESITNSKLSPSEASAIASSSSGERIWNNPLFLPFKIAEYFIIKAGLTSVYLFRAIPALFGVVLVFCFYLLARLWFSPKIAWVASIMLLSSGLFLNYTRLAVPDVLFPLGLLSLLWSAWWVFQNKRTNLRLALSVLIVASSLYIPGLIWFTILVIFIQRKHLSGIFKRTSPYTLVVASIVTTLLLSPLIRALILQPQLAQSWLAFPESFSPQQFIQDFIYVPASLVVRAQFNPVFNLARLPYLDILTICLVILGSYAFLLRLDLVRTRALIGAVIISWFIIAFDNSAQINLLLPLIYLTVAAGIMFMLQQWYSVFPKNPIARNIGLILLFSVISISLYYNTTRYFVAWANNPVSQQAFQIKPTSNLLQ
jgi:hypothetical protein